MKAHGKKTDQHEYFLVALVSLCIAAFASLPYIVGYAITPVGFRYLGFAYDSDDICVYLSWMRQAAEGHFFLRNLFTSEPQAGHGFNLLFLALGSFARITRLPLEIVFHLARVGFGFSLLLASYKFSGIWLKDMRSRHIALLVIGLSAGFGGYFLGHPLMNHSPIDLWQPEATTFFSIYFSPLFTFPMLLMVGIVYYLIMFTEQGKRKHAVYAGLMLFLLVNIHTYDVIPLALLWLLYSAYKAAGRNYRAITGGLLAAAIAVPMAAYQVYFYLSDPVFQARAAIQTQSPSIAWVILGYGLLIPLAAISIWRSIKERKDISLLICWVAGGLIASYLPFSFQRKLIMGTHIPLAILASIGLVWMTDRLSTKHRNLTAIIVIAIMFPSNLRFMLRDINMIQQNRVYVASHAPFAALDEMDGLAYLEAHGKEGDIVLAHPGLASIIPWHTGLRVFCGHWGETKDFFTKCRDTLDFFKWDARDKDRLAFLRQKHIAYVVEYHKGIYWSEMFADFRTERPTCLTPVFENELLTIYRVVIPGKSRWPVPDPSGQAIHSPLAGLAPCYARPGGRSRHREDCRKLFISCSARFVSLSKSTSTL